MRSDARSHKLREPALLRWRRRPTDPEWQQRKKNAVSEVPYYKQIADTLRLRIVNGVYAVGQCIPSAMELETAFEVSNITIRKALNVLRDDGWIETQRGIGSVVARNSENEVVDIKFTGAFTDWLQWASGKSHNIKQTVERLGFEQGSARLRSLLQVKDGSQLWCLSRSRAINGDPISYHLNYAKPDDVSRIKETDLEGSGSFIALMRRRYPGRVARIEQYVEATIADMDLANRLHIKYGDPLFFVEHHYIGHRDEVIVVAQLFMRADRYRYRQTIKVEDEKRAKPAARSKPRKLQ